MKKQKNDITLNDMSECTFFWFRAVSSVFSLRFFPGGTFFLLNLPLPLAARGSSLVPIIATLPSQNLSFFFSFLPPMIPLAGNKRAQESFHLSTRKRKKTFSKICMVISRVYHYLEFKSFIYYLFFRFL